ncbi:MAG: quinolinate synthase NadA [Candidatus Latescibacterota bacterium]|nr:MAG: quinolinate synthase NadA [Candidatus Latescibacterota bacterium]
MTSNSIEATYEEMREKLEKIVPEFELRHKAELVYEIRKLKEERGAVILGHNYMEPALYHFIPDFRGDSFELSRLASETDKDPIVFCGVIFMAETAKILSPQKTVLIPSTEAGCSLAASITGEDVRLLKKLYPGVPVVTYVNTYADVKAETDICCTSSNAVAVVNSLDTDTVIFLPDEYLAKNVAKETGRHIVFPVKDPNGLKKPDTDLEYAMVGWEGKCEVHEQFTVEDIENVRKQFPDVFVLAHPECSPDVVQASDFSGSTSAMIRQVEETSAPRYLLLTECSMGDNIVAENPEKELLRLCSHRCPHMNQITLEQTLDSLKHNQHVVEIPEEIRIRAKRAVDRMLEIT